MRTAPTRQRSTKKSADLFTGELHRQLHPTGRFSTGEVHRFSADVAVVNTYELILPCTSDDLVLRDEPTSVRAPEGRIVAGFDVGRTRDRSELAVFEEIEGRFTCRMLKSFEGTPFAEQEAELRRLLGTLPVARLSIDSSA